MTFKFLKILLLFCLVSCDSLFSDPNAIILGTTDDNPPFEFMRDGEIIGLDIDIANAIARKINKKLIIKNYKFHELLKALDRGNVDFVIAGISITPQRKTRVDFSQPYHTSDIVLLFRNSEPIRRKEDLQEKKIGAQLGTVLSQIAKDLSNRYHIRNLATNDTVSLIEYLKTSKVDAIVVEQIQAEKILKDHPEFGMLKLDKKVTEFGIAFSPHAEKRTEIENAVNSLILSDSIEEIKVKWLGNRD